ncbi:MAG: YeeE/YedE family protein [Sphingopyxis sp.]|nr:YeeE/YedE family protein [Sphingopyxis sp.]
MKRQMLIALVAGALFGAGLALSGMADPQRVRGFLDLFGAWDPTLAFVMAGAIAPMAIAWRLHNRMIAPLAAPVFSLPTNQDLDPRLIGGAVLFGIGWGIAGLCPGPAIADLAIAPVPAATFVAAMLGGMILHRLLPAIPAKPSNLEKHNV